MRLACFSMLGFSVSLLGIEVILPSGVNIACLLNVWVVVSMSDTPFIVFLLLQANRYLKPSGETIRCQGHECSIVCI